MSGIISGIDADGAVLAEHVTGVLFEDRVVRTSYGFVSFDDVAWLGLRTWTEVVRGSKTRSTARYWELQMIEDHAEAEADDLDVFGEEDAVLIEWKHVVAEATASSGDVEDVLYLFDQLARRTEAKLSIEASVDDAPLDSSDYRAGLAWRLAEAGAYEEASSASTDTAIRVEREEERTALSWEKTRWTPLVIGLSLGIVSWVPVVLIGGSVPSHRMSHLDIVLPMLLLGGFGTLWLIAGIVNWYRSAHGEHRLEIDDQLVYDAPNRYAHLESTDEIGTLVSVHEPDEAVYVLTTREAFKCPVDTPAVLADEICRRIV